MYPTGKSHKRLGPVILGATCRTPGHFVQCSQSICLASARWETCGQRDASVAAPHLDEKVSHVSQEASCGINQLVSISRYLRPVMVCQSKMNGPYTVCFDMAQNTLSLGESRSISRLACDFHSPISSHCTCWPFHLSVRSPHHWKWYLPAGHHHFPLTLRDSHKMYVGFPRLPGVTFGPIAAC